MSDTGETEPETEPEPQEETKKKKSLSDYITKKHVDNFLESLLIITVSLVFLFFYPLIRYYVVEGLTLAKCYYSPPVGHGEPLGGHAAPETPPVDKVRVWPAPITFFDEHVAQSRPVILQAMATEFPAFKLWSDEYLRTKAGSEDIKIRNSEGQLIYKPLDALLDVYRKDRLHLYTTVPESLRGDLFLPLQISCGNFPLALNEVVLWMNGGNLTVGLNTEFLDGLHCSLKGQMSIVLINRLQHEFAKEGVTTSLENRQIDLCVNRSLRRLGWFNVTLVEGDCLYIPSRWYKEVSFQSDRNLGVSFRFTRLLFFNQSDCEKSIAKKLPDTPSEAQLLKYEIISLSENHAALDYFTFQGIYLMPEINDIGSLRKLFDHLDEDSDGEVLPEDMYGMNTEMFLSYFEGFSTRDTAHGRRVLLAEEGQKQPGNNEL